MLQLHRLRPRTETDYGLEDSMKIQIAGLCSLALLVTACGESPAEEAPATEPTAPASEAPSLAEAAASAEGPFAPRDDCGELYGFDSFRGQLRRAITFQNTDSLAALVDPDIRLDFGGDGGIDALKARLADDPSLWSEMSDAIALGCSAEGETAVTMPWAFANLPDGAEATSTYLVTANDAPVRAEASGTAASNGAISWDLVKLAGDAPADGAEFVEVSTLDDATTGFVAAESLRPITDYRILASRGDDGWKVTAFVAGD